MWPLPLPGDVIWCRFPERPRDQPGPKPRPALVLEVTEYQDGATVHLAYGTSQHMDRMHSGEFAIRKSENGVAYALAGLSFDTKFDLKHVLEIPWDPSFFDVPKLAPYGNSPKMGTLHSSLMKALQSAALAARK